MIDIQTTTVRLGERDYTIQEAPRVRARPWRQRLMAEIKPIFEQVGAAQDMQFESPADLLKLVPVIETLLLDAIDSVYELLIMYAPELEADREYIEAHASDRQIFVAFQEVLKLADFFGVLPLMNRRLGRAASGTLSN